MELEDWTLREEREWKYEAHLPVSLAYLLLWQAGLVGSHEVPAGGGCWDDRMSSGKFGEDMHDLMDRGTELICY